MHGLQLYLLIGLLSSFLGSTSILLVAFALWIYSLRADLEVYAPLADAPKSQHLRRLQRPRPSLPSRRPN